MGAGAKVASFCAGAENVWRGVGFCGAVLGVVGLNAD